MLPATLFAGGFRGNAPVKSTGEDELEGGEEKIAWNWHDSVKVQGAAAVRHEKVRMLALEGVKFGEDGKLVGGMGAVWKFEDGSESGEEE